MAITRRNAMQIEEMRSLIHTERIINRLQSHIVSNVKMKESQVRAALGLLKKVIPDLSNVELQAGSNGPIFIVTGIMRPDEPKPLELTPDRVTIEAKPLMENDTQATTSDVQPSHASKLEPS